MSDYVNEWHKLKDEFTANGQIEDSESLALYTALRQRKIRLAIEVGTNTGNGSTYWISAALLANGHHGLLHTIEVDPRLFSEAQQQYMRHKAGMMNFMVFHCGTGEDTIPRILNGAPVDFALIDGCDGDAPVQEVQLLEPAMPVGSLLCVHDWYLKKTECIRGYLESSDAWRRKLVVGQPNSNESGLAFFDRQVVS